MPGNAGFVYIFDNIQWHQKEVVMNFKKSSLITAAGILAILAGCSSTEDVSGTKNESSNNEQDEVKIELSACEELTDKEAIKEMDNAQQDIYDFMEAFADGDLKESQKLSATLKTAYSKALDAHPGNCEAQVGYALATVADLLNNKTFNDVVDTIQSIIEAEDGPDSDMDLDDVDVRASLYKINAGDAANIVVKTAALAKESSQKVITDRIQDAIANEMLPAVDTAITYFKNVMDAEKFSIKYSFDKHTVTLDNGEFGPAVAALYVTRAIMTAIASFDIDVSKDGKYDWIDTLAKLNESNYKNNPGAQYVVKLLDRNHPFGTVKKDWLTRYKNIPKDLESAVDYVKYGFEYKLYEAENKLDQSNDMYVVGKGEDADMSVAQVEKIIDSLEYYKKGLSEAIEIKFDGKPYKVNLGKFFEFTSDIKGYAPYYQMVKPEDWFELDSDTQWEPEIYGSYAAYMNERQLENDLAAGEGVTYASAYFDNDYDEGTVLSVNIDYEDGYAYANFNVEVVDCVAKFTLDKESMRYYNYTDDEAEAPEITVNDLDLGKEFCKVDGKKSLLARPENEVFPNFVNFTDKSGKVTASFNDFVQGRITPDDIKSVVIFPDYTFGGMFPEMTETKFWDFFDTYIIGDDNDEDDYED